ncbi:MAG: GlsB/YeaQ/YmgE family stress response membrane protein [Lysobacteraceae bacterium]
MGFMAWILTGGFAGCLASLIMQRDEQQGIVLDILVGIVGAVLAGWTYASLIGTGTVSDRTTVPIVLVSLPGAVILLAIVGLLNRDRTD